MGDAVVLDELAHQTGGLGVVRPLGGVDVHVVGFLQALERELLALREDLHAVEVAHAGALLAVHQGPQLLDEGGAELLRGLLEFLLLDLQAGLLLALRAAAAAVLGNLLVQGGLDHGAAQGRIGLQGGVLHVAGLVTEDGLEELLFRGRIALALRGDLADHDVARLDVGADAHDTVLVEVLGGVLADVRDIGRKFLHAALGLAVTISSLRTMASS